MHLPVWVCMPSHDVIKGVQQCVALRLSKVDITANIMTICPPQERVSTRRPRTRTPRMAQLLVEYMVYMIHH